jgi:transposase
MPSTKKPDLSAIAGEMKRLGASDELCALMLGLLESMTEQNTQLALRLQAALRQLWRPKSERVSADQLLLFLSKLPAAEADQAHVETTTQDVAADGPAATPPAKKKPRGKQPFPATLPRRVEPVLVPEAARRCTCGREKIAIGFDSQFLWEFEPAQFFLRERRLEKLACKCCEEAGVTTAEAPGKPIDGARPGPGLLAQIVTAKFQDACPLYRQSQIYERSGIHLAPSTLGDWCAKTADELEPLWKFFREQTLTSYLLSLDDTKLPVLDREDPRGIKRGHIWTYIGDQGRAAFCAYTPDWSGAAPQKVLADFTGCVIQSDGYAGIDGAFARPGAPIRAGCMDHARRRWVTALEAGDVRAAIVVKLMADVYAVEADARARKLGDAELLALRHAKSRPIMDRLQRVIADLHAGALPKSPLGKATTYAINQWSTLVVFLDDARVPLSNIQVEQQQRRPVLARKNFLFSGSDDGARRVAILQTIVVNCALAKVPIWQYLRDTLARLADGWPQSRIAELTPVAWAAAHKQAAEQANAQQ